jgi:Myb/SANT-like DNA-binding protein
MPNTIEWSEEEMQCLIDLRRDRNEDYWRRFGRSKVPFWNEIATKIQEDFGTAFTGVQVQDKFKRMVNDCKVSKYIFFFKKKNRLIIFTKKNI